MTSNWEIVKAEDFCFTVTDGTHDSPKAKENGHYLITSKHLAPYNIDFSSAKKISEEDYQKVIKRSPVEQWDILFSMIGTIGITYLEKNTDIDYACKNMGIFKFNGDKDKAYWLYYYLQTPQAKEYILGHLRGTTQQYLPLGSLRDFPIQVPSAEIRNNITSILRSLDDRIAVNTAINENLEQQAQALFKAWFVDFEPFGGVMPDDWRTGSFSDIIESTLGGDWGKETPTGNYTERVFCIRGADIPEVKAGNKGKMPTRYILPKNFSNKKLIANDIVVEISGGSPTQSTGRVAAISQSLLDRYDSGMICTNFCRAIKPCMGYSNFIYYYWQYLYDRKVFFSYENGTTGIKNLDISGFTETEPIIIPSVQALKQFNSTIDSFYSQIFENGRENEQLASLRDTLLPKLMNGEIDVSAIVLE